MKKKNKYLVFFLLTCIILFSCSSNQEEAVSFEKIIEPNFNVDVENISFKGFKLGKNYNVDELPKAELVRSAIFNKKDIEIRKYLSQADALEFGEIYAKSVTGNDAIVSGDDVMWKEGSKDRRKCVPRAGTSESGCDQKARYGDYIVMGNMIILCEGLSSEEAMILCHNFKESLLNQP
tara:strand:+ start:1176 stop:1709 length:534 start_codon:yes stop_codon:yes gene_type:complete